MTQTIEQKVSAKFTQEIAMPIDSIIVKNEYAYCVSGTNTYWCRIVNDRVKIIRGRAFRLDCYN
jgi:hypothetical protein